jgi:murein DD-endopeptidase MepM/ murein hydrolase activator NlpD
MFRKSARGLFDLLLAAMAAATLMTTTPTGELIGRGLCWAHSRLGGHAVACSQRNLISYFGDPDKPAVVGFTAAEPNSLLASVAREHGTAPSMLKGFALASAADPGAKELAMDVTPAGKELLAARGASPEDLGSAPGRLRAVSQAITDLSRDLGSPDAALCALVLGLAPVQYAVERVRAERGAPTLEALSVHLPPGSRAQVTQTVGLALAFSTLYELAWPVPRDTHIASRFGSRVDPISGARTVHTGVDLSVPTGTKVFSTGDGKVKRAGEDDVNGRFVVIDHGRGISSCYCHNSELRVARGVAITRGENITLSGNTGRSTGPHLHYQVAIDGVPIDPLAIFAQSERPLLTREKEPATPGKATAP